ncbi:unnamed protein product [Penicillium nalgiovense]|nr:unnamed protein product [Penicillium nalgiovense]CAG8906532.1 unnamed protein product [Penicillium nalgiovense]CAG8907122.1 unnamed protein product [Penicillium nalgiovense]
MPSAMMVTALMKTIRTFCELYEQEVPYIPVTRAECEASKYLVCSSSPIPMRSHAVYHFHMTAGGIDDESPKGPYRLPWPFSQSTLCISHVLMCLPDTKPKPIWPYTTVCLGIRKKSFLWIKSWRPLGDPHCPRLASRIFPSLELRKTRGMLVDFSGLMAGEPYLRRRPDC